MLCPLFARSALVEADTTVEGAALASVRCSAWAQPASVVAGTTGQGAALSTSLGWRVFSQPLWWQARQLRALLWTLFDLSQWAQPGTVLSGRQVRALLWPLIAWSAWVWPSTVVVNLYLTFLAK